VDQDYLPENRRYYEPTERGFEAELRLRLEVIRGQRSEVRGQRSDVTTDEE